MSLLSRVFVRRHPFFHLGVTSGNGVFSSDAASWRRFLSSNNSDTTKTDGEEDDHVKTIKMNSSYTDETSAIISKFKSPIVQQLWEERSKAKQEGKAGTSKPRGDTCAIVEGKTPSQSETKVEYPFTKDGFLSESYKSPWNTMRIGKILEDLDALAGNIAFYHVRNDDNAVQNPLIVTASVDRIRLSHTSPIMPCDQILSGRVTYVGTSSMEIRMHCTGANDHDEPWLEAYVTFVTLDPVTKKPMHITPLLPQTAQEQADFDAGAQRAAAKKERRKQQKNNTQISPHAEALMRQARPVLLKMPSLAADHSIQMSTTAMQNALITQPTVRNLHDRIFGGFLMRRAFELAFANAYVFGGARPVFQEVDEIAFTAPVDVGDLLVFNSRVLYTSSNEGAPEDAPVVVEEGSKNTKKKLPLIHIEVETWVTEPEKADAKLSNQFYFTFAIMQDGNTRPLRQILPANIDEAFRMANRMEADRVQGLHD